MIFNVFHSISYRYSTKVFFEPLILRLKPRSDAFQKVEDFKLEINPKPSGITEGNDLDGAQAHYLYFSDQHDFLEFKAQSTVRTKNHNPFDFILPAEEFNHLPLKYPQLLEAELAPYLLVEDRSPECKGFTEQVMMESQRNTLAFLIRLTTYIHETFKISLRETGHPLSPQEVLIQRGGACRDLTHLFMEVCRLVGIAARYVSGYTLGDDRVVEGELHAWAEVYLPGGGWRGYDPTLGLAVAERHIALTSNREPFWTLPLTGSFRGDGAETTMDYQVQVQALPSK